jgi:hypothetical protein
MVKLWIGLTIMTLGLATTAQAQSPVMAGQAGTETLPDPTPIYDVQPTFAPSSPYPGAGDSLNSLPSSTRNAWDPPGGREEHKGGGASWYAYLGYMGLERQRLGHGPVAVFDQNSGGVHTGLVPATPGPLALDFQDLVPNLLNGITATVGYYNGAHAFEVSGFYTGETTSNRTVADPGRLHSFFNVNGSVNSFPLGFEGDNGMWLQSDLFRIRLQTAVGSAEANYRTWTDFIPHSIFNWSLGLRYLDLYERLGIFSGDADLTIIGNNGQPNPILEATYAVTTHNRIVAPQLGAEWSQPLACWLAFTLTAKGAWGVNFTDADAILKRGDGLIGLSDRRSDTIFSQLYEVGLNFDFFLGERIKFRAGYDMLWALDVAAAVDQVSFNLANPLRKNNEGTIFYAGPVAQLQFLF